MSITHYTTVMVGVEINEEYVEDYVTKYNEDTGEPYNKLFTTRMFTVGNKRFRYADEIVDHFGLDVIDYVVGKILTQLEADDMETFSEAEITEAKKRVADILISKGVNERPDFYVLHNVC